MANNARTNKKKHEKRYHWKEIYFDVIHFCASEYDVSGRNTNQIKAQEIIVFLENKMDELKGKYGK